MTAAAQLRTPEPRRRTPDDNGNQHGIRSPGSAEVRAIPIHLRESGRPSLLFGWLAVGHPDVRAVQGNSGGVVECIAGPFQHFDQSPGGGVQLSHPAFAGEGGSHQDVSAVQGYSIDIEPEPVARADEFRVGVASHAL